MKLSPLHASLMTLALFATAGPSHAASADTQRPVVMAQAEAADLDQIRKFLAGGRDLSRLNDERLQQRLNRVKRFQQVEGLPPDLSQGLDQEVASITAETERRQQAAAEPPEPQPEPQQQAQPEAAEPPPVPAQPEPEVTQQVQQEAVPETAQPSATQQGPDEVALFLQSVRPASELSGNDLRRQMRRATELSRTKGLSQQQRRALRDVIREARADLRSKGGNDAAETAPETPPQPQQQAEPQTPAAKAVQPAQVDPALERQARAIVRDNVDVRAMSRRDLRQRLAGMRDLLASDQLSPETREALREKLATERRVLRNEVSGNAGERPPAQGTAGGTAGNNVTINNTTTTVTNTDVRVILRDERPPGALEEKELVRRIDVYRDVVIDERYDEAERRAWRRNLERDRRELRRRMLEDRSERAERLRSDDFDIEINLGFEYDPRREMREDVFAAEVEDEELIDVLAAPPRRQVNRRYTVEEIQQSPEARDSVARIEIDTVNFGFGEGFLREEEIDKLDRIAEVLERILAQNPGEVFMLEGHTDAVGSDAANLQLSRQRAQAVKEALTTYYVIPAENLRTVGLGERYLKIPTQLAEAENRRVSLARITALVGELD